MFESRWRLSSSTVGHIGRASIQQYPIRTKKPQYYSYYTCVQGIFLHSNTTGGYDGGMNLRLTVLVSKAHLPCIPTRALPPAPVTSTAVSTHTTPHRPILNLRTLQDEGSAHIKLRVFGSA